MSSLYLICQIKGSRVAISCEHIESVIQVRSFIKVPKSDPAVAGLYALRSKILTLIDCNYVVSGMSIPVSSNGLAVVVALSGHLYGMLVETTAEVVAINADNVGLDIQPSVQWMPYVDKIILHEDETLMLLNLGKMVEIEYSLAA